MHTRPKAGSGCGRPINRHRLASSPPFLVAREQWVGDNEEASVGRSARRDRQERQARRVAVSVRSPGTCGAMQQLLAADGRQAQQADGLEAVLDGGRSAAAVDSDQQRASVAGGAWQHRGGCQADVFGSLPRSKRGSQQHAAYAYNGHHLFESRACVYSVACHGVVRVLVHACVVRASMVDGVSVGSGLPFLITVWSPRKS